MVGGRTGRSLAPGNMTLQPSESHDEISVVLVDDHELFREGLKDVLEDQGLKVVARPTAASARSSSWRRSRPT